MPIRRWPVLLLCSGAIAQTGSTIDDGVYRWSRDDAGPMRPSFSFEEPARRDRTTPGTPGARVRPAIEREDGTTTVIIDIDRATSLYGTGEVGGRLLRNGLAIETWNTDAYGYDETSESLYQSHPWVLAVREDGTSFGVLADTTARVRVDLDDQIRMSAPGPDFPVVIIERDTPDEVVMALSSLTGTIDMPPMWALGYHQCRYSYDPADRVREIASEFRARSIPCDVIWMDIDYMDGYRCFTFDPVDFPDPAALNDDLHAQGFRTVWMIDPGIKKEEGYFVYDEGTEIDAWVKTASGETFVGDVWPGACVFPDFTNRAVRTWWAGLYEDFLATGIDGVWNDMNEPAVFNVESKTMPLDNVHRADEAFGGPGPHALFHNVYGMQMIRATREGILALRPERRPFVLSRANFIGGHRYGATWSGDNTANWAHLEASVPMVLNLGLSGQPFSGPDIGGFVGDGDGEMFARWMGVGALMPFARGHTGKENRDKEPWSFGPEVERTSRLAIERRYRLLPYLYTLFDEASRTGMPIARPVFFADPTDPALRSEDDAFLLGGDLLVECDLTPDARRATARPDGIWRQIWLGETDPDLPDLFLRGGSILPVGPVMDHVGASPMDELELLISLDARGTARGVLYEDAGEGWDHLEGDFLRTTWVATLEDDVVTVRIESEEGDRARPDRALRATVVMNPFRNEFNDVRRLSFTATGRDGEVVRVPIGSMK